MWDTFRAQESTIVSRSVLQRSSHSRRRYSLPAVPKMRHPRPSMWHISRATKHNRQFVSVTTTMNNSSTILTICSTKIKPSAPEYVAHFATRELNRQLVTVAITTGSVHGTLTPCSDKIRQSGPKHSLVIRSKPCTDTVFAPHLLLGLHVGTFLDQSLDNLSVPIHGSPDQGRPVLLRDVYVTRLQKGLHSVTRQIE
jgi:hypothetical protein